MENNALKLEVLSNAGIEVNFNKSKTSYTCRSVHRKHREYV